jgi:hypothetical protein
MDDLEAQGQPTRDKASLIADVTSLLRLASQNNDPQVHRVVRDDTHFRKLGISSIYAVRNALDRALHDKAITYLDSIGLTTDDAERAQIRQYFEVMDRHKKRAIMDSYGQNGLLTLSSALERNVLGETSSTPGDFTSLEYMRLFPAERADMIIGYTVNSDNVDDNLFYGSNGFFDVVL